MNPCSDLKECSQTSEARSPSAAAALNRADLHVTPQQISSCVRLSQDALISAANFLF